MQLRHYICRIERVLGFASLAAPDRETQSLEANGGGRLKTVVLQSQRPDRLSQWQRRCCESVAAWADRRGFAYRFVGDELFTRVSGGLRERYAAQPVVLSDLARLLWLRDALADGYERAIWCDADLLIFADFVPDGGDRFGRECWIQAGDRSLRSYRKIHNAWLQFQRHSVVLPFYIDRAQSLLERAAAPVVPQFIGPKLLTAWHNIAPFAVEERIGMLSPPAMAALLQGGGEALDRLRAGHDAALCGLNLSASCAGREVDGLLHTDADYERVVAGLQHGDLQLRLRC